MIVPLQFRFVPPLALGEISFLKSNTKYHDIKLIPPQQSVSEKDALVVENYSDINGILLNFYEVFPSGEVDSKYPRNSQIRKIRNFDKKEKGITILVFGKNGE